MTYPHHQNTNVYAKNTLLTPPQSPPTQTRPATPSTQTLFTALSEHPKRFKSPAQ